MLYEKLYTKNSFSSHHISAVRHLLNNIIFAQDKRYVVHNTAYTRYMTNKLLFTMHVNDNQQTIHLMQLQNLVYSITMISTLSIMPA